MKIWNESRAISWTRMILLISNIILIFVFRGNKYVIGWTFGVNLVIILESLVSIIVSNHNFKEFVKPLKRIEKEIKEELEKLKEK